MTYFSGLETGLGPPELLPLHLSILTCPWVEDLNDNSGDNEGSVQGKQHSHQEEASLRAGEQCLTLSDEINFCDYSCKALVSGNLHFIPIDSGRSLSYMIL